MLPGRRLRLAGNINDNRPVKIFRTKENEYGGNTLWCSGGGSGSGGGVVAEEKRLQEAMIHAEELGMTLIVANMSKTYSLCGEMRLSLVEISLRLR